MMISYFYEFSARDCGALVVGFRNVT